MKKTLTIRTTTELAYIDGNVLFEDCVDVVRTLTKPDKVYKLDVTSEPIQGSTKALKIGNFGNTTQFRSKDGTFSICNTFVNRYTLGKQFYYKINKSS